MRWEERRYRPYIARYGGEEIVVVPRDRELSNAQQSGLDPGWFQNEVYQRTKGCDFPALVTTWTDGENGGWFRNVAIGSGFWGCFYHVLLNRFREGTLGFTSIHISDYIRRYPPYEVVDIHPGAWKTGHHWEGDFAQWTGSLLQKKGWDEVRNASAYYHRVKSAFDERGNGVGNPEEVRHMILRAYDHILTAETSCNFYWGSRWVNRAFNDLEQAYRWLDTAVSQMPA